MRGKRIGSYTYLHAFVVNLLAVVAIVDLILILLVIGESDSGNSHNEENPKSHDEDREVNFLE